MHPRLFTTLILIEPILQRDLPQGPNIAMSSSHRKDIWPSFDAAESAFRKNKYFAKFDKRVLDNIIAYGLRKTPTAIYPLLDNGSYTLTTSKHQEVWSFIRPNFESRLPPGVQDSELKRLERLLSPDTDPSLEGTHLFYRPEMAIIAEYLRYLRPHVLYLFGAKSPMINEQMRSIMIKTTGVGLGGSGGVEQGQVDSHVFEDWGHMVPCEDVGSCANFAAGWLSKHLRRFIENEKLLRDYPREKSDNDMLTVSEKWMQLIREPSMTTRPLKERL